MVDLYISMFLVISFTVMDVNVILLNVLPLLIGNGDLRNDMKTMFIKEFKVPVLNKLAARKISVGTKSKEFLSISFLKKNNLDSSKTTQR